MKAATVYQLEITLQDIKPAITRTVLIPPSCNLSDLHYVIQDAMPWKNYHIHQFQVDGEAYADPMFELDALPEGRRELGLSFPEIGSTIIYEYDFGDDWTHEIKLTGILMKVDGQKYPTCTAGKNACPPEDCGGPFGYPDFVEAITDPEHEEHQNMKDWVGGEFDPSVFDVAKAACRIEEDYCRKMTIKAMAESVEF